MDASRCSDDRLVEPGRNREPPGHCAGWEAPPEPIRDAGDFGVQFAVQVGILRPAKDVLNSTTSSGAANAPGGVEEGGQFPLQLNI